MWLFITLVSFNLTLWVMLYSKLKSAKTLNNDKQDTNKTRYGVKCVWNA